MTPIVQNSNKLQQLKTLVDNNLHELLDNLTLPSQRLAEAIRYSVLTGGKRLRPLLIYLAGEILQLSHARLHRVAAAVELIHCYSLIHDDLPAMDNDDLRRGIPSCHRAFDEATAILAGDGLQAFAFQLVAETDSSLLTPTQKNDTIVAMCLSCGVEGMVSGQALDLELLNQNHIDAATIANIHQLKTGKLLSLCVRIPIIIAEAQQTPTSKYLLEFAEHIGIAYQMQDDYLDQYGSIQILGKHAGSDSAQGKLTYASLFSQQQLNESIQQHYHRALEALAGIQQDTAALNQFANSLLRRSG